MKDNDRVLIAGAGPVGCVAALHLSRNGIPVTLLEACAELPEDLRASTFHPPTLDMLDELGVVERLISEGMICPVWQYRDARDGVIAEWDLGVLANDTGHPYRVQCEQYKLTRIIVEDLAREGSVDLRFRNRVVAAAQDDDGVSVEVETPGGRETLRGRYLVAADGASSVVRIGQGIGFDGLTFPELWLCASTAYPFDEHFENLAPIAYVAGADYWFVFVRVPGLWRLLMPSLPGESAEMLVTDESVQRRMQRVCPREGDYDTYHRTAYAVHQRVADTYRKGRIFLAGDSAHINNPLGGMGMNGGIHDAVNLCEKLCAVWHGRAGESELDRYDAQRRPIAIEYVQLAALRNKALLEESDEEARRAKHDELRRTAADPVAAREYLVQSSMIGALARARELG